VAKKCGRHTSAFLLLFLSEGPLYGALLLSKLQTDLPHCFSDSADVYRTLQELEQDGLVETSWDTEAAGQPRKWYTITSLGKQALKEQREDICMRLENFNYFLEHYKEQSE